MASPSAVAQNDLVQLPAAAGRDHATLALLPLTVASQDPVYEAVTRLYQLPVDGKLRRFSVTLQPGEAGLPVHGDGMIYLALLQLHLAQDPVPERLTFHRPDLFELLRWPRRGRNYERLKLALVRLHQLSIRIESALIARDGREYSRTTDAAHLIDRFHLSDGAQDNCWLEWGGLVRQAFALGDFKRLDWDLLVALGNPLTSQLYRLLDRVVLSGEQQWKIGWRPLANALGMSAEGYARPARFHQRLQPHLEALIQHRAIDGYDYGRGGQFTFHLHNYLRGELRRVLRELGVYEEAARQLLSAHDEAEIMTQCDCLQHGARRAAEAPGGYLVDAVRKGYELRYDDDEPTRFKALWDFLTPEERELLHQAALAIAGGRDSLFDTNDDPAAWTLELRAITRFMISHGIDAEQVLPLHERPTIAPTTTS